MLKLDLRKKNLIFDFIFAGLVLVLAIEVRASDFLTQTSGLLIIAVATFLRLQCRTVSCSQKR
jgi:hypothetical protein